jgi:Zn-finger nucleic acid-binding protein
MKCPVDGADLMMSERNGIEVDYCPQCRGVWLDRGELDKILERSAQQEASYRQPAPEPFPQERGYEQPRFREEQRYDPRYGNRPHKKRRESFLDDLFDFG